MKVVLAILFYITIPNMISLDAWSDESRLAYLRNYHGEDIIVKTDFSEFTRSRNGKRYGERCRLWIRQSNM